MDAHEPLDDEWSDKRGARDMKTILSAAVVTLLSVTAAHAGTYRLDTVQSVLPINYPVYAPVATPAFSPVVMRQPVVVQQPVVMQQPIAPAMVAPAQIYAPAPIMAPAPFVAPMTTYYAPAPVYYAPVRARTIVRPWGARTVYRYW
jgi:hypothetical protein